MKLRNIVMATYVLLSTATMSFADSYDNMDTSAETDTSTATSATTDSSFESNTFIKPFANTYSSLQMKIILGDLKTELFNGI